MADEKTPRQSFTELRDAFNAAVGTIDATADELDKVKADPALAEDERSAAVEKLEAELHDAVAEAERLEEELMSKDARERARSQFHKIDTGKDRIEVKEPDMYQRGGRSFVTDLFNAQVKNDPSATERIYKHQQREVEKRATTSSTLGGIIPPQYMVDMYAKASRNGRVFADRCNGQPLPDVGMSLVVPRLTQGLAAGFQSSENSAVSTQDPTETDLTVNVRTIGGYLPVSRQGLERAAYSDQILFEDLLARYWAALDVSAINGAGSPAFTGLLQTSNIATSSTSTATVAAVWPKIADVIQQINTNVGGLGYVADTIVMHPRRWGFFEAALDSQQRPILPTEGTGVNVIGSGQEAGYGFVGRMHGLNVYTDANVPTNLGTNTNEDRIIVMASPVVHLWERANDPVTLSFEQQAGTSLQVQLIAYGYAAFTAGRYPGASGAVSGAGLVAPTF